ncbi:MAG TPA: hypothetical protein VK914_11905 [bacterium]|jgi:hypothetical protein|nr:hypothetical protein [bacterium]
MKEIRFPSMLSMDYPGLVSEALAKVRDVPAGETFTVDLTETQKISAFGVAALGACLARLVASKRLPSGSIIRRPENGRVSNDLMRMGLYRLLQEASINVYTGEKIGERPQELWLVERPQELENAIPRLVNILRGVLPASKADFERVMQIFSGLSDNVFRHGAGHSGAVLCGQAFPKNGVIEVAVADTGQGIWGSLKRLPGLSEGLKGDSNAILTALALKVKSPDGSVRLGLLNTLLATVRKTGGEMVCMSGEAALSMRNGEMRSTAIPNYPGTVVGMRLRLLSPTAAEPQAGPTAETPAPAPAKA